MLQKKSVLSMILCFLSLLLVVGCGSVTPEPTAQAAATLSQDSPLATPTTAPTATSAPTSTPRPTSAPARLVVLHTNDNWGETEPCG